MQPNTIRVIYIVPSNAKEWADAKPRATEVLEDLQHFFADEMNQRGYGPKTFEIARDANEVEGGSYVSRGSSYVNQGGSYMS